MTTIEARPYGPESTQEEREALAQRVYVHAPGIVMYREAPIPSVFQLEIYERKLAALERELGPYKLLVDLTGTTPPSAEVRAKLKSMFRGLSHIEHIAVFTGKNFMINVTVKFVVGSMGISNCTMHTTLEQALAAVHDG